jgi:hypothetical protein
MHPLILSNMARSTDGVCLHLCVCMSLTDGRTAQRGQASSCVIRKESSHFLCTISVLSCSSYSFSSLLYTQLVGSFFLSLLLHFFLNDSYPLVLTWKTTKTTSTLFLASQKYYCLIS